MSFTAISINKYIKQFLQQNPKEDENEFRLRLNSALEDYKNGVKCLCGNDIWVVASASGENICYSCLTGKEEPTEDDFELNDALKKQMRSQTSTKPNNIDFSQLKGLFDE